MRSIDKQRRIELGRASEATKGVGGYHMETQGLWDKAGLSDR
jgi:hypothetical protein